MAKKKAKKNWIAEATAKNKGSFTSQAAKAGESVAEYADDVLKPGSKASAKTKKRAQLSKTLAGFRKKKKGGK